MLRLDRLQGSSVLLAPGCHGRGPVDFVLVQHPLVLLAQVREVRLCAFAALAPALQLLLGVMELLLQPADITLQGVVLCFVCCMVRRWD